MLIRLIKYLFRKRKNVQKLLPGPEVVPGETDYPPEAPIPPSSTPLILPESSNKNIMSNSSSYTGQKRAGNPLPEEFVYIRDLILYRLESYFPSENEEEAVTHPPLYPDYEQWRSPLADFIETNNFSNEEATLLLIVLIPHIQPELFNSAIDHKLPDTRKTGLDFPQIGGVRSRNSRFFLPTGETALFLIAGDNLEKRLEVQQYFGAEHLFWEKKILWLEDMQNGEPAMQGRLIMSADYIDLLTYGMHKSPQFSISFPAKKIAPVKPGTPPLTFDHLVISDELRNQINELRDWIRYSPELMGRYGMGDKLRKGYRTVFYGPPGTGKTFTAQILGNDLKREVYRIDLSMVVSKYIGETEKNLELLFARAEDKEWILFFDEADAIFGKRTNVRDAHDKYANQEVSYLLQRIEDYNGLVILATNMKNNIDDAFIRRFNSIIKFPFPTAEQRAMIWEKSLPADSRFIWRREDDPSLEVEVNIPEEVKKYELSGGNIINVVQYAGIRAVEAVHEQNALLGIGDETDLDDDLPLTIYLTDVLDGIKREMIKEGRPFQS
ncbi:MAG: ATP-binding protein [Chitinophagaceae bacterium]